MLLSDGPIVTQSIILKVVTRLSTVFYRHQKLFTKSAMPAPRILLIACGSFSPPTPMHLRMFGKSQAKWKINSNHLLFMWHGGIFAEIARDHFQQTGSHEVIGGIMSPVHDGYGKKGLAAARHRCAMVKLALQSSSWIRLSDWEVSQDDWSRTMTTLKYHQVTKAYKHS